MCQPSQLLYVNDLLLTKADKESHTWTGVSIPRLARGGWGPRSSKLSSESRAESRAHGCLSAEQHAVLDS